MASLYGEVDAIRVLLTHMPAQMKANEPQNLNLALSKVKIILLGEENVLFILWEFHLRQLQTVEGQVPISFK